MPEHHVPPEWIEAAGNAAMREHHFRPYDPIVRTILLAVYPAIREAERRAVLAQVEDRFLTALSEQGVIDGDLVHTSQIRAALASLKEESTGTAADCWLRPSREARGVRENPPAGGDSSATQGGDASGTDRRGAYRDARVAEAASTGSGAASETSECERCEGKRLVNMNAPGAPLGELCPDCGDSGEKRPSEPEEDLAPYSSVPWPEAFLIRRPGAFPYQHAATRALAEAYLRKDAERAPEEPPSEYRRYLPEPSQPLSEEDRSILAHGEGEDRG